MANLRRVLKFILAGAMVLLIVSWVASLQGLRKTYAHLPFRQRVVVYAGLYDGTIAIGCGPKLLLSPSWNSLGRKGDGRGLGELSWHWRRTAVSATLPFPLLLSALLPLAIGCFTGFRFRLWHSLAYTSLIAVELAYYLQWQK